MALLRVAIVVAGVLGWLAAVGLIFVLRDTERSDPSDLTALSLRRRLVVVVTRVAGGMAGAALASLLTVGLGGRLMMRILAATSPDAVQGRITDADAVIGEATVDGTLFLVLFVTLAGGLAGLAMFTVLRRWLPRRSIVAGLLTVTIGAGVFARPVSLLNPDSIDFDMLQPVWLAIVTIVVLLATFGALGGVLIDRWKATWPEPNNLRGALCLLPIAPLMVFMGTLPLLVGATLFGVFAAPALRRSPLLPTADRVGRVVVAALTVGSGAWLAVGTVRILVG